MSPRKKPPTPAPIQATEVDVVPTEVVPVPEVEVESAVAAPVLEPGPVVTDAE